MGKRNLKECSSSQLLSPPWICFPLKSYPGHSLQSPFLNFLTGISAPDQKSHWGLKAQRQCSWYSRVRNMPLWHKDYFELKALRRSKHKKTALPSSYLKASHQFVKVFPFPSLPGRTAVNHWRQQRQTLTSLELASEKSNKPFYKWPFSAISFPMYLPSHIYCPQKLEVLFLCLVSSLKTYCLLRIYISPSSYHPFELLIAQCSHVYDPQVLIDLFFSVNLSFVSLI